MAEWKFGTVLRYRPDQSIIMVVGFGGDFNTDDGYNISDTDAAWGVTLWVRPGTTAWGDAGDTTWIPGGQPGEGGWDWEVVDE